MSRPFVFVFVSVAVFSVSFVRPAPVITRILRSPCPDIFGYERIHEGVKWWIFPSENHRWRGIVTVTPVLPISLKIKLLVPALLPSKYVGRVELADGKDEVVKQIETGSLSKIKYYVYFPGKIPIPDLMRIEVNSRVVCSQSSPPASRQLKTILTLEHSLMTMATNVSTRDGIIDASTMAKNLFDVSGSNVHFGCGKTRREKIKATYGIPSVSIGDWPWMVPLFKKTDLGLQFLCSSTLISRDLVVTAAHCVKFKNFPPVKREDIIAYVGRYDISNWTDENSQPRELSAIFIHPDFDSDFLHSDLAVLKFSRPIEEAGHVSPACLWQGNHNLSAVVGRKGIVFGWGTNGLGTKVTSTPKLAVMPIVSQEECLRSNMEFLFLTTNRTLCAGFRNGTGPCSGDSGGGLLIPQRDEKGHIRWVLRGIVSLSLMQDGEVMCDVHEYTVFTDVAKYQDWILGLQSTSPNEKITS
ncbi:hypothetical protein RUM43_011566 [Polyplax serrata]|uniref:Peptidase S1 domain-containing protein n=1 Tax=Polyplax serrata TaxID=468196 RepID=A0AAN8NYD2_POLSC